jgi:hypothetical protein
MPKKKMELIKACQAAKEWSASMGYDESTPMIRLWDDCDRLDWMMWFYFRLVPPQSKEDRFEVILFIVDCYADVVIEEVRSLKLYATISSSLLTGMMPEPKGNEEKEAIEAYGVSVKSKSKDDFIYTGLKSCYAVLFADEPENFANVAITALMELGVDLNLHRERARGLFRSKIVDRAAI